MHCAPKFGIVVVKSQPTFYIEKTKMQLLESAYEAVNAEYFLPHFIAKLFALCKHKEIRTFTKIWDLGPTVINHPTRISPVVMMRQLLAYHLSRKHMKTKDIASVIGLTDHTSALHNRERFRSQLAVRHDTFEKAVYSRFKSNI